MIETSQEINDLSAAMAKAQAVIEGAIKDSANPHFHSKYADLSSVWAAWQKCGPANGLAVMQFPGECVDNRMHMTTLITHTSGQWIKSDLSIPLQKVDAQGYGSATTYARRYALSAAVGIAPEDDDGNAASNPKGAANDALPAKKSPQHSALKTKVRELVHEMEGCGDWDTWCAFRDSKPFRSVIEEVKQKLPEWFDGGPEMPDEFVPLGRRIEIIEANLAQGMAEYARG